MADLAVRDWTKKSTDSPIWDGPRSIEAADLDALDSDSRDKIQTILDAMDWPKLIVFRYGDSDRLVAPFVVGVSSIGNPLLRGYQLEGVSLSGKGEGWRVFQVSNMENLLVYEDFFNSSDFDFDEFYPWVYKVFKML